MNRISVKETALVDEFGRERIFNGINMVYKGALDPDTGRKDYIPDWNEETFANLKKYGINIVRLGLIWDAVEPECGKYNENYLDVMCQYADWCAKYGIYFYLDMHQDLYAAAFSDGAPEWATLTDSYKFREPKLIWAEGYFIDKAVHRAFDNFWNNAPVYGKGLQDHYADMWKHVVEKFKDKEGLLGFDIMNEPFPGTDGGRVFTKLIGGGINTILFSGKVKRISSIAKIIKGDTFTEALGVLDDREVMNGIVRPGAMLIRRFDVKKYYPFFRKVSAAIREVTSDGVIIMENCYYSNVGIPCTTPRLVYDDGTREPNLMFAPHGYDLTVDTPLTNTASNCRVDTIFDQHARTQSRLNVPVIVGEWGGMVPGCEEYPHLEHLLEKFDSNKWSQTYWVYFPDLIGTRILEIIGRPYPQAVCGNIESYRFDRLNDTFTLKYTADKKGRKYTEIFLPKEPKDIVCPDEYKLADNGNGTFTLKVTPVKGENFVAVKI